MSFGLTEIYDKETDDPQISGYGYELTLKLKKYDFEDVTISSVGSVMGTYASEGAILISVL